jgi:hypothetical protein
VDALAAGATFDEAVRSPAKVRAAVDPKFALFLVCLLGETGCSETDCQSLPTRSTGRVGALCGADSVTLPVLAKFKSPVVEAVVDGQRVNLLFDTGSSAPLVYSAKRLGRTTDAWLNVDVCLGAMCFRGVDTWAHDSPFSTDKEDDVAGFLGMPALVNLVLEVDHLNTVSLTRSAAPCVGVSHPVTLDGSLRPFLSASVDGREFSAPVLLDTGAMYTVLGTGSVGLLGAYVHEHEQRKEGCTLLGCVPNSELNSVVHEFCVEGHCAQDVEVNYPVWDAVGDSYLSRFRVSYDFPNRRVTFCD